MAFPSSLDTFPDAADLADDTLATKPHSTLHGNLGTAVAALEAKVGVDSSAVTTSHDYKLARVNQAIRRIGPVEFDFNDADLIAGRTIYTPAVGDISFGFFIELTTLFNGTSILQMRAGSELIAAGIDLTSPLTTDGTHLRVTNLGAQAALWTSSVVQSALTTTPWKLHVDSDGAGGATGATAGVGKLYLYVDAAT